ncbi:hypothetical protein HA402_011143 [Bradysia odoriphaga]|nr:hypothetical protein HA402_011143 [Bradysia odoriphaga]
MLRPLIPVLSVQIRRQYATKIKKCVILQDKDKIPVDRYPLASESARRVYVWGHAATGALGYQKSLKKQKLKHTQFVQHPSRLQFAEVQDVIDVACGYGFSAFAVKRSDDISLFGCGINTDSQVGFHKFGGVTNRPMELMIYPAPIVLPKRTDDCKIQIKSVAAGRAHLLALSEDGVVFTMGNNAYGQCGRPVVENEKYAASQTVHQIEELNGTKIAGITCGQDHSLFLLNNGTVYSCGWGADGQTGLGHYKSVDVPTLIGGDISTEKIVKVAGTVDCVLMLNDKGEVFGFGNAEYGQLETVGDSQQVNEPKFVSLTKGLGKIVDIAAGGSFCMVLNENGNVFVWGYGILGLGPKVDYVKEPYRIPPTLFGRNEMSPDSRVTSISCGISHMAAINSDNDLYMWGRNKLGCLGLGHKDDQFFPLKIAVTAKVLKVSCGVDHTLALCKPFI